MLKEFPSLWKLKVGVWMEKGVLQEDYVFFFLPLQMDVLEFEVSKWRMSWLVLG